MTLFAFIIIYVVFQPKVQCSKFLPIAFSYSSSSIPLIFFGDNTLWNDLIKIIILDHYYSVELALFKVKPKFSSMDMT